MTCEFVKSRLPTRLRMEKETHSLASRPNLQRISPELKIPPGFVSLFGLAPWSLSAAVFFSILSALLSLVPFWCLYHIAIILLSPINVTGNPVHFVLEALIALVARWIIMTFSHICAHKGAYTLVYRLRWQLARHLGKVPLSYFSVQGSGSLWRVLDDDVSSLEKFYAHLLPDMVTAASVPIATLVYLGFMDWRLALASISPLPFAAFVQWKVMCGAFGRAHEWSRLQRNIADQINEFMRGIAVIKSFNVAANRFSALSANINAAERRVRDYASHSSLGWVTFSALMSSSLIVVAPFGVWLCEKKSLEISTFLLFLFLAPAVLLPLKRLTFAFGEKAQCSGALERIDQVLRVNAIQGGKSVPFSSEPVDIVFDKVSLSDQGRKALFEVSFTARRGEVTALVGPSGAGKTTVARMAARLADPDQGQILVGGISAQDWPLDVLLGRIAYVGQDVHLFQGSIIDNIRLGRDDASDEEIVVAARAARAHDFIKKLPEGYNTIIGSRGGGLSGGEKQRLSIARALLKRADILVLDEVTAYADSESEYLIQEALSELCRGRTVLMVAHRLNTIVDANQIVVLDRGQVVGKGEHRQLMQACPLYQQMWRDHGRTEGWRLCSARGVV